MRLKKFLSAALSAAMLISCVSFGGGTVVQAAGEMNIARNLQISAYSGTEGDFPVSSVATMVVVMIPRMIITDGFQKKR